ncbi:MULTISPECIES: cation:proton antiporter [unclassified Sphingopyxis]|uniref:cation:proton antiporter n=1 Tax=unclassified Sphingopyxis TaxID=2614943 RepID=UPI0024AE0E91|nr:MULTISPECIES: cation:proton antiporter [unclassified Sphingopyxis]
MAFVIDLLCFLVVPLLCWRLVSGAVPLAVLPILTGLAVAIAADRFGFDKSVLGPSPLGDTIGWLGVLALAFSAGLETRTTTDHAPRLDGRLVGAALAALSLPFMVGFAAAVSGTMDAVLARPQGVSPLLSAAAIGLCLSVSALPVLVGIVRELPVADRPLGHLALRIAALDDAILWSGLALLLFLHRGEGGAPLPGGRFPIAAIALIAAMAALRSRIGRFLPDHPAITIALGVAYLAAGSWSTATLGLHELLGAYFAGAMAPKPLAERLRPELVGKVALFGLSPLFFAHRGLSIDGAVVTVAAIGAAMLLLLIAGASKLAAVHLAPPDASLPATERTRLGLLLQCKGLMEIVAATILAQAGLITPTVFAVLVTLALLSTTLTVPLFRLATGRTSTQTAAAGR